MAPSQKKKNIAAIHEKAATLGLTPLLEISSKSERPVGRRLSAFSLKLCVDGREVTLESAFQGSKIFEHGGPFTDLYWVDSRSAKRDPRLKASGRLIGFRFQGRQFPLSPATLFYDWLYFTALYPHRDWLRRLDQCAGFTDIEFNPQRSMNCQARSFAAFMALKKRGVLEEAMSSFESFECVMKGADI